jgi:quercetin dioxygenase-like cupin family protein
MPNPQNPDISETPSFADTPSVIRTTVQVTRLEPVHQTAAVEVRRITIAPGFAAGLHFHNGPVFGNIVEGSVIFQTEGEPETVLRAGDVFYEPANAPIARFDATEEGVVFLGYFLLEDGQEPVITT